MCHYSWGHRCVENGAGRLDSSNDIEKFRKESASYRVCSSARDDDMLYRVQLRAERARRAFVGLVKSKPVICQVITGEESEMEAKLLNILGVVDML